MKMVENDNPEKKGQENVNKSQECCTANSGDKTCCSSASGSFSKGKLMVLVIIIAAAGIVLARSLMKESNAVNDDSQQLFASIEKNNESSSQINAVTDIAAPDKPEPILWGPQLDSLTSLNELAADSNAVYVFLAGEDQQANQAITNHIEAAAKKIQADGNRIRAFKLKKDAPNYAQLEKQFFVPCVVAMVKGGGMSTVSGEINTAKLLEAFVKASRPSGCGTSGCGPKDACPK